MDTEHLIKEVKRCPALYDQDDDKFRNTEYKEKVWKKIAIALKAKSARHCKNRWGSIRDQFRKIIMKRKRAAGNSSVHIGKYKFEYLLQFLVPHILMRETNTNTVLQSEENEMVFDDVETDDVDTERLIEEVRRVPALYDQTDDKFRNTEYKEKIWKKIATTLKVKSAIHCKNRWGSIRDQFRKTIKKRTTMSGQAAVHHRKYKFENQLQFLVPHIVMRETNANVFNSEESEMGSDDVDIIEDVQEGDYTVELESPHHTNIENIKIENKQNHLEGNGDSTQSSQSSLSGHCMKKDTFVRSGLATLILANKEAQKKTKKSELEQVETHPVDAFLAGLAPSLKLLNPILFNQAKTSIFSIVQEYEMKQLVG